MLPMSDPSRNAPAAAATAIATSHGDRLWDFGALAEYLNVGESTVKKSYRDWGVPFVPVGGAIRFRRDQVDAWLEQRMQAGAPALQD